MSYFCGTIDLEGENERLREIKMHEYALAYQLLTERFNLRHKQRTALDQSNSYHAIMEAATWGDWETAEKLLINAGIIVK